MQERVHGLHLFPSLGPRPLTRKIYTVRLYPFSVVSGDMCLVRGDYHYLTNWRRICEGSVKQLWWRRGGSVEIFSYNLNPKRHTVAPRGWQIHYQNARQGAACTGQLLNWRRLRGGAKASTKWMRRDGVVERSRGLRGASVVARGATTVASRSLGASCNSSNNETPC